MNVHVHNFCKCFYEEEKHSNTQCVPETSVLDTMCAMNMVSEHNFCLFTRKTAQSTFNINHWKMKVTQIAA